MPKTSAAVATPPVDPAVQAVLDRHAAGVRDRLLALRALIYATARETPEVGALVETVKWGDPAYLPAAPRIGTTLRINAVKGAPGQVALLFHCRTSLFETFSGLYPTLRFDGRRAILLGVGERMPERALRHCVRLALTYRLARRGVD